jgi:hypothetical protein
MSKWIVDAVGGPVFHDAGNAEVGVSVSKEADGAPVSGLKPSNFRVWDIQAQQLLDATPFETDKTGFYFLWVKNTHKGRGSVPFDKKTKMLGIAVFSSPRSPQNRGQTVVSLPL